MKIRKYTEALTSSGKILNPDWQHLQIKNDRLSCKWIPFLTLLSKCAQEIYPDLWEIQPKCGTKDDKMMIYGFDLILFFPDGIITNEEEYIQLGVSSNDIRIERLPFKEIFTKLSFRYNSDSDCISLAKFELTRTNVTHSEYLFGGIHPHVAVCSVLGNNGEWDIRYQNFCIGRDTELATAIKELTHFNITEPQLKILLWVIETVIYTQSDEGMPYWKIHNIESLMQASIANTEMKLISYHTVENAVKTIVARSSIRRRILATCKFKLSHTHKIEIKLDDAVEQAIYDNFIDKNNNAYKCTKSSNGTYNSHHPEARLLRANNIPTDYIYFRNKQYRLTIEGFVEDIHTRYYLHPQLTQFIKNELESKINNVKSAADFDYYLKNTYGDNTRVSRQGKISMFQHT